MKGSMTSCLVQEEMEQKLYLNYPVFFTDRRITTGPLECRDSILTLHMQYVL